MLAPTTGGALTPTNALIKPWWPSGLPKPSGNTYELVKAVWEAVARRTMYMQDGEQLDQMSDCWVAPSTLWERQTGDCEDHAILIVSMLRTLRVKAWLVWGESDFGDGYSGHAWVETEIDDTHYLIEATSKPPMPEDMPGAPKDTGLPDLYASLKYRPESGKDGIVPSRTDGEVYAYWSDGQWHPLVMTDPVLVQPSETKPAEPEPPTALPNTEPSKVPATL
jgi:hypothetical protein